MAREKSFPLAGSLLLHIVLIGLLGISFSHKSERRAVPPPQVAEVVEAVAVDDARVQAELKRLQEQEKQRKAQLTAEKRRAEKAKQARQAEERRLKELKKKRAEEKRQQQDAEKKRKAETARQKEKLKAEQQRLEKIKQEQQALEKKQAEEQARLAEVEKQRKIEAEKQRLAEEEARRKAEEEARRKAEEEHKRQQAEQALKQRMAEEQSRLQAERNRQLTSMRLQYQDLVADKVRRNWLRPAGSMSDFSCTVLVQQLPGGDVVGVQLLESCGNSALDRSVESAVRKASPLPKPPDPELFDREIEFNFEP